MPGLVAASLNRELSPAESLCILVVTGRPEVAQLLVDALERAPYSVTWRAVDTEDRFREALASPADLVFSDMHLEHFTPRRALEILGQTCPEVPMVSISESADETEMCVLARLGMHDVLLKHDLARLGLVVERAVRERNERRRRRILEVDRSRLLQDLRERVKELTALHSIALLLAEDHESNNRRFQRIVEQLPPAMQHPRLAEACLRLGERQWVSKGYCESECMISRDFTAPGKQHGSLAISYRSRPVNESHDPFLDEERALLATVTEMLQEWIERDHGRREMARMALMLANVRDAVVVTDAEGVVTYWNDRATELFGWSADEMIGRPLESRYDEPDMRREARNSVREMLAGESWFGEFEDRTKDGSSIWVSANDTPIIDHDGSIRGVISVSRDVTAAKNAEAVLRSVNEELESRVRSRTRDLAEREALVRATVDAITAHIALLDPTGLIVATNQAWKTFAADNGASSTEVSEGANYLEACNAAAGRGCDSAAEVFEVLRQVLDGRLTEWSFEYPCSSDGEERWFLLRVRPVTIKGNIHALVAHENITRMKLAQEELRCTASVAEQANHAKSTFLMTMSHELRTPLNGILGMNELLLTTELNDSQREFLEASTSSGEHLLELINDVLDLSRIETGKLKLERVACCPAALVTEIVNSFAPLAQERSLELAQHLDDQLPNSIRCDRQRLQQVLINLVGNALKFTHAGRIVVSLFANAPKNGAQRLRFEVTDTGIGIPQDRLHRVFDSFSQVDDSISRRYGGSGLGLSICRELVELMGGEIGVESRIKTGSTFWFEIPIDPDAACTADSAEREAEQTARTSNRPPAQTELPQYPGGARCADRRGESRTKGSCH